MNVWLTYSRIAAFSSHKLPRIEEAERCTLATSAKYCQRNTELLFGVKGNHGRIVLCTTLNSLSVFSTKPTMENLISLFGGGRCATICVFAWLGAAVIAAVEWKRYGKPKHHNYVRNMTADQIRLVCRHAKQRYDHAIISFSAFLFVCCLELMVVLAESLRQLTRRFPVAILSRGH